MAKRLGDRGLHVLNLPALVLHPLSGVLARPVRPGDYDLIVFVSSSAARIFLKTLPLDDAGFRWPDKTRLATVGAASAQLLYDAKRIPDTHILHPDPHSDQDSESLWTLLAPSLHTLERVLIMRGESGREWLGGKLEEAGISVERMAVYGREPAEWTTENGRELAQAFESPNPCVILLTSSEGVDAVHRNMQRLGLEDAWKESRFVTIHERVASRLQSVLRASGKVEPAMVKICQPSDDAIFKTIVLAASL